MDTLVLVAIAVGLLVAGIVLIFLETIVPSAGALTVLALLAFAGSVVFAIQVNMVFGVVVLCLIPLMAVGTIVMGYKVLPHTPMGRLLLSDNPDPKVVAGSGADSDLKALLGKTGVATSDLRPSGIVEIDDRRYDVVSEGPLIEQGARVEVFEVRGNRCMVRRVDDGDTPRPPDRGLQTA
jgi:membrane-bound serine protease (ClpP class)